MEKNLDFGKNKIFHLEDSMMMYDIYNVETLEKIVQYT